MFHDLRAINTIIHMGALQTGLPNLAIIPSTWTCLAEHDKERLAFSLPVTNTQDTLSRYQWILLPQRMD